MKLASKQVRRLSRHLFLTAALLPAAAAHGQESLTVVSWGGSYARAQVNAFMDSFEADTGIEIKLEEYSGGLAQVRTQVESGNVTWDIIYIEAGDLLLGCDEGLLEDIAVADMRPAPDGTLPEDDWDSHYFLDCGIPELSYATVIAYNRDLFADEKPSRAADFFDLERFPGRRGMRRMPLSTLEFALVADGVPQDQVYETLSTPEGLERAFAKLDTIKSSVVWWETGAQPPQMLADGEVVMSTAFNGRIFNAQVLENQPLEILWDGQLQASSYVAIIGGTPRLETARRYLEYTTATEAMARLTGYISYGPLRESSLALVGEHVETGVDMQPHLPTAYADTAVVEDPQWWADHLDEMNERFAAWLAR